MAATRERIVTDWTRRLAEAEAGAEAGRNRAAWLSRLRVRLYRFLISLYGDGRWNAAVGEKGTAPSPIKTSAVFESADALPLAGKPAKSGEQIRGVLAAVANAQDERQQIGPWTEWVVVATKSSGVDLDRCARLFGNFGIVCRMPDPESVATPRPQVAEAEALMRTHWQRLSESAAIVPESKLRLPSEAFRDFVTRSAPVIVVLVAVGMISPVVALAIKQVNFIPLVLMLLFVAFLIAPHMPRTRQRLWGLAARAVSLTRRLFLKR